MPIKTGLEVLVWVRKQPGLQKLPVIVLTGAALDSSIRTAYALGASSFLTKPPNYMNFSAELELLTNVWLADSPPSRPAPSPAAEPLSNPSGSGNSADDHREAA
jgi:DNA-binding response OmpR family regulator